MNKIEMSLDDIIKNSKDIKNYRSRGRGGARGSGAGGRDRVRRTSGGPNFKRSPARRGAGGGRPFTRSPRGAGTYRSNAAYNKGDVDSMWTHDLYDSAGYGGGIRSLGGGGGGSGKLLISNLDFGVSNSDIKELFSEFGPLKSAKLHYDRSGRSLGTADLVYERRSDAIKAMKQYNGVPLDGRPMQIQLAADASVLEARPVPRAVGGGGGGYRNGSAAPSYRARGGGPRGGSRGSARGGRGGRGGRNAGPVPTQAELDAELDAYREKMDTS